MTKNAHTVSIQAVCDVNIVAGWYDSTHHSSGIPADFSWAYSRQMAFSYDYLSLFFITHFLLWNLTANSTYN